MQTLATTYITLSEAAQMAGRTKPAIRRWITEGWVPESAILTMPGRNGAYLIERELFTKVLPDIVNIMESRKGGRGVKSKDAQGRDRV